MENKNTNTVAPIGATGLVKKHSAVKTAFAVAAVYFGAVVGPDLVGGSTSIAYFTPYGKFALIPIIIDCVIIGLIMGVGCLVPRTCHVYDYNGVAKISYGKLYKVLSVVLDIYVIFAMFLGGAVVISVGGDWFATFGLPKMAGYIVVAIISALLVLWGDKLVRATSSIMAILMIVFFVIICCYIIFSNGDAVSNVYNAPVTAPSNAWVRPATLAIIPAITLGSASACNGFTQSAVMQNVRTRKDAILVGIFAGGLTAFAYILSTHSTLAYSPEMLTESVPILVIIQAKLSGGVGATLRVMYYVVMMLALISSGAPQFHAIAARFKKVYPNKGILKSLPVKNLITGLIYFTVCIFIAGFGVIALITKGYAILGYVGMVITLLPLFIITPIRMKLGKIAEAKYGKNIEEDEKAFQEQRAKERAIGQ